MGYKVGGPWRKNMHVTTRVAQTPEFIYARRLRRPPRHGAVAPVLPSAPPPTYSAKTCHIVDTQPTNANITTKILLSYVLTGSDKSSTCFGFNIISMVRWCTTCEDASGVTISVHLEPQNISIISQSRTRPGVYE